MNTLETYAMVLAHLSESTTDGTVDAGSMFAYPDFAVVDQSVALGYSNEASIEVDVEVHLDATGVGANGLLPEVDAPLMDQEPFPEIRHDMSLDVIEQYGF